MREFRRSRSACKRSVKRRKDDIQSWRVRARANTLEFLHEFIYGIELVVVFHLRQSGLTLAKVLMIPSRQQDLVDLAFDPLKEDEVFADGCEQSLGVIVCPFGILNWRLRIHVRSWFLLRAHLYSLDDCPN